jgi:hypothetical protein
VSTHSYIGIRDTDRPNLVRARYVHSDGHPGAMIPTLRAVWAGVAGGDTTRLITLLLGHDWDYLDPAVTDHTRTPFAGQQPVAEVGMTLAATDGRGSVLPPEPVTVVPLTAAPALDAEWIYLLDPASDTVVVHTADADPIAVVALAAQPQRVAVEGPPTAVRRR